MAEMNTNINIFLFSVSNDLYSLLRNEETYRNFNLPFERHIVV